MRPSGYGANKAGTPAFAVRGIVEGFYGVPWTHAERLDLIAFIAERGMNTYVYTPKDDPLMRREWRTPYSGAELAKLQELIDACRSRGVDFVYCLSPGLSIRYSSEADVTTLATKFAEARRLGAARVGLLLDDIPAVLQYDEDAALWPTLAAAHVDLVARLAIPDLIVCPTQYYGRGDEEYITTLGQGVPEGVDLFFTGRLICSPFIDLVDAERFTAATGHAPLYWDNYPVNDVAMSHELHIGPYRGRDPQLATASRGVIANGMQFAESSKIAFATIADYLWSPDDYDPDESWAVALADVVGGSTDDLVAYTAFAENSLTSCLNLDDAVTFSRVLERSAFFVETGRADAAAATLTAEAERLEQASAHLLSGNFGNARLVEEARPWLESFRVGAQALRVLATLAAAGTLETDGPAALGPYRDDLIARRKRVFGDALDMTLADITAPSSKEAAP